MIDYANVYTKRLLEASDGHVNLTNKHIKYGDALAAICYAHDIDIATMLERFPEAKTNERWSGVKYTVNDQIDFVKTHAKRTPKKILEIGAGRGEVTLFLTAMGYSVTAIEPSIDFEELIKNTNQKLFPDQTIEGYKYINSPIHLTDIDYSEYDTIVMVESLEHILAEHFDPQWDKINQTFQGYFTVVNWKKYHPIAVGQYASKQIHCRLVDDELYDKFSRNHTVKVRDKSHLCIEL